jgi:hypothetical protein
MTKLSDEQVEEIRSSDDSHDVLAERYGCSPWTIKAKRRGHVKAGRPRLPRPLCECGCGDHVREPRQRYLQGHHERSDQANWLTNPLFLGGRGPQTDRQFLRSTWDRCEEVDRGYSSSCWLYTGRVLAGGYATAHRNGQFTTRHREVFRVLNPDKDLTGLHVDHLCAGPGDLEARRCMNPSHLAARSVAAHLRRHKSNLTREAVDAIRARHAAGESATDLAAEYGYQDDAMRLVINRKRWADES